MQNRIATARLFQRTEISLDNNQSRGSSIDSFENRYQGAEPCRNSPCLRYYRQINRAQVRSLSFFLFTTKTTTIAWLVSILAGVI